MAKSLPVIGQEDLDSFTLTRTGSSFALKAFHVPWNIHILVKLLTSPNTTEREWKLLLQDIANIRHFQSEHLLPSLGIYQYHGLVGIVTEWMKNRSLHSLIHEHQLYPELPFPLLIRILSDVAEGLHYLHSLKPALCHGSLKPSNVLLDGQYRAKISDYGLTHWRKEQWRSDLQNCNHRNCQDLVYLSPETLERGFPSQEGDIYRCSDVTQCMRYMYICTKKTKVCVICQILLNYIFGILCWESLSRQKPFEDQKILLEVLTKICSGLRPGISAKFIPSNLPHRNRLLHLIILCWHQEPDYRPHITECTGLLKGILTSINKEAISTAIYKLMDAKETALNACKGSEICTLQTGICNSEIICAQKNKQVINKKIPLGVPNLSAIPLDSSANNTRRQNTLEMASPSTVLCNTTTMQDHPDSGSRKSNLGPSFSVLPSSGSTTGRESSLCHKDPPLPLQQSPQSMHLEQALSGPCCKGNCCQILTCRREVILSSMTEGRLNHILDVLRSQQTLSRVDYETITSYPTVTGRTRALLDTCLCLGERAAQVVVTVLSVTKCSPLAQSSHGTDCPSKINRLLQ